jgi:hypothetical protein
MQFWKPKNEFNIYIPTHVEIYSRLEIAIPDMVIKYHPRMDEQ